MEQIYDIIPMLDGSLTMFGYLYGNSDYIYPWGQSLWLVHTDSLGCDGFGSCDTNITVTFSPPLPDTMCVTDTFHTIAKLTGTNYSGEFNLSTFLINLEDYSQANISHFQNIDTTTNIPIEITYHGYSQMVVEYELVASDTAFHENLLSAKDTTLLSGFTATHMPVYSPFPSHLIRFITECPDTNNAINTLTLNNELYIYPNPATNNLTVAITNDQLRITNVRVFDITGRQMLQARPHGVIPNGSEESENTQQIEILRSAQYDKMDINIKPLPAGIYFVKVTTDKGTVVRKFVKQ